MKFETDIFQFKIEIHKSMFNVSDRHKKTFLDFLILSMLIIQNGSD